MIIVQGASWTFLVSSQDFNGTTVSLGPIPLDGGTFNTKRKASEANNNVDADNLELP